MNQPQRYELIDTIKNREDAIRVSHSSGTTVLLIAGIQAAFSITHFPTGLVDGAIFGVLGLLIRHKQSRVAACFALLIAALGGIVEIIKAFTHWQAIGMTIIFALVIAHASINAIRATFFISKAAKDAKLQ